MQMPRSCCVLGCESNRKRRHKGSGVTTFCFPNDERRKKVWLKCINREDLKLSNSSAVCIRHFREDFIIRESTAVREDGFVLVVHRQRLKLADNAYPSLWLRKLRSQCLRQRRLGKTKYTCEEGKMVVARSKWRDAKDKVGVHNGHRNLVKKAEITLGRSCQCLNACEQRCTHRAVVTQHRGRLRRQQMRSPASTLTPNSSPSVPPSEPKTAMADNNSIVHTRPLCSNEALKMKCDPLCGVGEEPKKVEIEVIQSCCVPGCFSNLRAPLVTMFPFPQDECQRRMWLKCINRDEYFPTQFSAVCIHHFKEEFILREIKTTRRNGVVVFPTDKPILAPGAFPSLFIGRPLTLQSLERPTQKRRRRFSEKQTMKKSGHDKCKGKEEYHLKETSVNNLKEENHRKEACINNLNEENYHKETCINNFDEENHLEEADICNVKENHLGGACTYSVKQEIYFQEAIPNVKEEIEIHEQLFSNDGEVGFYLSPTAIKEEFEDEILIGF